MTLFNQAELFSQAQLQKLYQYALSLCSDRELAFDLLQTTVERYLKRPDELNNPMAYARTILRNLYIDHYRHQASFEEEVYEDEVVSLQLDMQTLEDLMIDRDALDKIWASLKPYEREILFLWAIEGFSLEEVARQIALPKGTVLARVHRLRQKLKNSLNAPPAGNIA